MSMEATCTIDQIEKKITDINFLLKKEAWTEQDIATHGDQKTLVEQKNELFELRACLHQEQQKSEAVRPAQNTTYSADSKYFNLNRDFLNFSDSPCEKPLILFCRREFHELFQFMTEKVLGENNICYLIGHDGVGKSVTISAYLSTLSETDCRITRLNLVPGSFDVQCTVYEEKVMKEFLINQNFLKIVAQRLTKCSFFSLMV
jgi:DNA replication protein DnaC